jgi:hypothetical protein
MQTLPIANVCECRVLPVTTQDARLCGVSLGASPYAWQWSRPTGAATSRLPRFPVREHVEPSTFAPSGARFNAKEAPDERRQSRNQRHAAIAAPLGCDDCTMRDCRGRSSMSASLAGGNLACFCPRSALEARAVDDELDRFKTINLGAYAASRGYPVFRLGRVLARPKGPVWFWCCGRSIACCV